MTRTLLCLPILFFLIPLVISSSSTTHQLSVFGNAEPTKIKVEDGSNVYLASRDKALPLSRITLTSNGNSTTLDKLLNNFDANSFMKGWPVNSDLTISTKNNANVTKELKGMLFICTPAMAADPNFLVSVPRGKTVIDRSLNDLTTVVFLATVNPSTDGMPHYAGFKHIRVENIVQPATSSIYFYRFLPDDYYTDVANVNTTRNNIFSNPLRHTLAGNPQVNFFNKIDPLQFSETMWFRGVGGFQLTVSDSYVDTTNIGVGAATVTGMSNSQLMTNTSQVTFVSLGNNRYGASGYVLSTDLFDTSNLTVQVNGAPPQTDSYTVSGQQNVRDDFHEFKWQASNLQLQPTGLFSGIYYLQYFNIDNGAFTDAPTVVTSTPVASSSPPVVGAKIYVASSDDESWLKNIEISNDAETKTALDILKMGNNPDGTAIGWEVKGTVNINSSNSAIDAEKLSGFLYSTTLAQEQDLSFLVYTVDRQIFVSHDNTDLTLVFLNQNLLNRAANSPIYIPTMSSYVSDFATTATTEMSVYWDQPQDSFKDPGSYTSQQQIIFSNPLRTIANQYFENVEPFQVFNDVWYIRSNGRIRFNVQPKWVDPNGSTTAGVTTTGLVMCSYAPENMKINMMSNPANQASTGLIVVYNLINPVVFKMDGFQYKWCGPAKYAYNLFNGGDYYEDCI
ncbi:hypothetical protein CAEBREN_05194 [Caenorhabditis brenneri]|uniref:Uncharacterized protein n=1 Tax=Caenorhabditis brenneri TaxID=135651 RepID=G0N6J0_CAEBE|nr:hypothetical protein CAEBREN_05194 [Caenorhabditis brenneri]